ncbi:glutamate-1-semialdehyde 2,1-aminomutase [Agreia bicolorata]|uniref:Glutamate-1-semialdehyde 2,1-aminomutase n=1 Tax=Agreia bicolorata TaxID=110935 RepID=A0A1T4WWE9_9MICO|nr:aminotransferase class III-fold pyridoxal phosphate-dependent enzyme [Agreia bicolorata]SKA81690.1 glutamate-1-semialdehyde 2,1-aminomutase [Agreia bicolorata]
MTDTKTVQQDFQERANRVLAGGVTSNTRLLNPHLIVERGSGSRLFDVDGREYIDFLLGQGPNFLGYAPPRVVAKLAEAQKDGVIFAATHRREVEAAERILTIFPWAETLRFGSSSSEMVQAALRIARQNTGRKYILRFHGHYHGWFDNIQIRSEDGKAGVGSLGQVPEALEQVITISWNDTEEFLRTLRERGHEIAGVIMEPIMLNSGAIEPRPGYLEAVRQACSDNGSVLIFDETISGFRLGLSGASGRFGVSPDLAVYGKAMAAGWPCAALIGKRELFAEVATGRLTHAGTFNGNVVATAAVLAALDELESGEVYKKVEAVGGELIDGIRALIAKYDLPMRVQGLPMAFHLRFDSSDDEITSYEQIQALESGRYSDFAQHLIELGVWVAYRGIWYVSAAHTSEDVAETLARIEPAFKALADS